MALRPVVPVSSGGPWTASRADRASRMVRTGGTAPFQRAAGQHCRPRGRPPALPAPRVRRPLANPRVWRPHGSPLVPSADAPLTRRAFVFRVNPELTRSLFSESIQSWLGGRPRASAVRAATSARSPTEACTQRLVSQSVSTLTCSTVRGHRLRPRGPCGQQAAGSALASGRAAVSLPSSAIGRAEADDGSLSFAARAHVVCPESHAVCSESGASLSRLTIDARFVRYWLRISNPIRTGARGGLRGGSAPQACMCVATHREPCRSRPGLGILSAFERQELLHGQANGLLRSRRRGRPGRPGARRGRQPRRRAVKSLSTSESIQG
jgi:hypothetical protein